MRVNSILLRPAARRAPGTWTGLGWNCDAAALIEFTIVVPLLTTLFVGIIQFGLLLNGYIMLTDATGAGARQFAISRGALTPYDATVSKVRSAALLTPGSITITIAVNGTACTTNASCITALTAAQGQPASVSTTYPCNLLTIITGFYLAANCTLSSNMTERVE